MTEQPTTAAGRVLLLDLVEHVEALAPKQSKPMHDATARAILAIEAEARQQDGSALRDYRCDYRCSLPADHGGVHLFPTHTALAALPPSAPPALDVERLREAHRLAQVMDGDYVANAAAVYARLQEQDQGSEQD